jgi:hypothetical protein
MPNVWGLAATAAAAAALLAPAGAATAQPVQQGNAFQTIGQLEAAGYDVVIDRVGSAPLGQCIVTNVRNPQTVTQTIPIGDDEDGEGHDRDFITIITSRTISVSLNCDV